MKEQTLNQELSFYFDKLSEEQKKSLLSMMKSFMDKPESKLERISLARYNQELEEAEQRISDGEHVTQDSLRNEIKEW